MFGNRRPAGLQGDGNSAVGHGMAHPFTRSYESAYNEQAHLRGAAVIASGLRAILPAGVVRWPHAAPTHIPAVFAMHLTPASIAIEIAAGRSAEASQKIAVRCRQLKVCVVFSGSKMDIDASGRAFLQQHRDPL